MLHKKNILCINLCFLGYISEFQLHLFKLIYIFFIILFFHKKKEEEQKKNEDIVLFLFSTMSAK